MNIRQLTLLLFASVWMVSCTDNKPPLSAKQLENVMFELYMSDEMATYNITHDSTVVSEEKVKKRQEEFVLTKYHIKKEDYDSTIAWYGKNLKEFLVICDNVERRLNEQKELAMTETKGDSTSVLLDRKDSINLLKTPSCYTNLDLLLKKEIAFELITGSEVHPVDTLVFSAKAHFLQDGNSVSNPKMSLSLTYLNDSTGKDSVETREIDLFRSRSYQIEMVVNNKMSLMKVNGSISFKRERQFQKFMAFDSIQLIRYLHKEPSIW
ncbi:MAG: DUF4296 domain-containing protein [Bacteroidales bacterium]|jgi:hypothetical protein|nr:DUF4296 domain-containing protein [Bacteroidales bacterium]